MRVAILGASGLLGRACFKSLAKNPAVEVVGSSRKDIACQQSQAGARYHHLDNAFREQDLRKFFYAVQPEVAINAISIRKTAWQQTSVKEMIQAYSLCPHQIADICESIGCRLIHISSDAVFSGVKGNYTEADIPDPKDLYGRAKLAGEVSGPGTLTLRTSMIGHGGGYGNGLIDWFLSQRDTCDGYTQAIFSGLPVNFLAAVIEKIIIDFPNLEGTYHISSEPISKYELLTLVAEIYNKNIAINKVDGLRCDRSLNNEKFRGATGLLSPPWRKLLTAMRAENIYTEGK